MTCFTASSPTRSSGSCSTACPRFQTPSCVQHFLDTVELCLGMAVDKTNGVVTIDGHETRVWSNGISVDPAELDEAAHTADFARYRYLLRAAPGQKTIMRV